MTATRAPRPWTTTGKELIRAGARRLVYRASPVLFARLRFRARTGRSLDLRHPQTFDEKLLWMMLYWRHPLKTRCADKHEMRGYVIDRGYGHLLPDLVATYTRSADIDFDALPDRFVLKCTHGCGFNIFCTDKRRLDPQATRRQLDAWMRSDYSLKYGEVHYADIRPRICCEPFLGGEDGTLPRDYKLHCFNGKVRFTTVCAGRNVGGARAAIYDHYDRDWQTRLLLSKAGLPACDPFPAPDAYDEMLAAAEALAAPFPYVRVDFFSVGGRAVIGEMTFTPAACIDSGYRADAQRMLGDMITLPRKRRR